jgi:small-conductance mechanosensitive channel
MEGKRVTLLRLFTQGVYVVGFYLVFLILSINNPTITFANLLEAPLISPKIINPKKFNITFSHILTVVFIIFCARIFIHLFSLSIGQRLRRRKDYDAGTEFVYVQIAKYIVYIISAFLALRVLFNDVSTILTGSIGIFLGIGLGLQDVFKDFFAGIVLLLEGNIRVGDVIEFQSGGSKDELVAKVVKINVRTTHIETRDGNVLIIPNTRLTQENIENWSHGSELSRFLIKVGVAYGSDTEEVIRLMKQAALSHPKVKKGEGVLVRLADFGESSLNMELIFWADQSWEINNFKSEIRLEIDRLFREYEITIPFPQRDVHVKEKGNITL